VKLKALLTDLPEATFTGDPGRALSTEITGLISDSRQVEPGMLFVAYAGVSVDGHRYIPQAVERGAAAVVGEQPRPKELPAQVGYVQVPNGREALALLAAAWHDHPGRKMTVIGVTGTDGKTTTVNLIQSILSAAGLKTGMVSTVNALIGDEDLATGLHVTTPDAPVIQSLLARMVEAGTQVAILETTSHGLAQHRVTGAQYDVAVVTNVTHEHLDEHGTWEQYCDAKARLFRMLGSAWRKPGVPKVAVLNVDDASYPRLQSIPADVQLAYGLGSPVDGTSAAAVTAEDVVTTADGLSFTVRAPQTAFELYSPLVEHFNLYNILAAVSAALALDVPTAAIQAGVAALQGVTGRMERVEEGQEFTAIVDFAHTPAALESALRALRPQTEGRLIAVFGCAGLRDTYKRAAMGRIAGELADVTVITAEDPRTEDLDAIIDQIAQGCEAAGAQEGTGYHRVADRGAAIALACQLAQAGDMVIAAGKGHERSMCFGTIEYPWSDHQAMRAALLERLGRPGEVVAPVLPTSKAAGA
jgi:UDP-N-acetylmuramoyl-L-alanyl-D-glutamate--2,6-diaminopimelate ligase